jgi:hypothetical protein
MNKQKQKKKLNNYMWKKVREIVVNRDKGCIVCGSMEKMNVHHLIPKNHLFLKYEPLNLVTLCPLHHRFSFEISAHQNPIIFNLFLIGKYPTKIPLLMLEYNKYYGYNNKSI